MKIGSLCSGIGGLELGLERAGVGEVVFQAEIDPYCRAVLAKHWPDVQRYNDVKDVDSGAPQVDVIVAGFPCQPVSVAGARKGKEDARWLWPEVRRIVEAIEPSWVVVENVPGLRTLGLLDVLRDLAALGFDAEWTTLSAAECGAPHLRRRLFLVASHTERVQLRLEPGWLGRACRAGAAQLVQQGAEGPLGDAGGAGREGSTLEPHEGRERPVQRSRRDEADSTPFADADADAEGELQPRGSFGEIWGWASDQGWREPPPPVRGMDDEFFGGLDEGEDDTSRRRSQTSDGVEAPDAWRIAALGNAVVPACAYVVGRAIAEACGN